MNERRRNKVKVTLALFVLSSAIGLTFYAYNLERNVRSRKTVAKSCALLQEALSTDFSRSSMSPVYEHDTDFVRERMAENLRLVCRETQDKLAWWRWNGGGVMSLPRDAAKEARLATVFERVHAQCPSILAAALEGMPGEQNHERALEYGRNFCEPQERRIRALASIPDVDYGVWDWAARLNAIAHDIEGQRANTRAPSPW